MDDLPKSIEQDLTKSDVVEVSDWVKSALEKARELVSFTESSIRDEWIAENFSFSL